MTGYRNVLLRSTMAVLALLSAGCAHRIQLRSPRNLDSLEVGSEASPRFAWRSSYRITRPGDHHEYSLVVAHDRSFRNVVFKKDQLESHTFVIDSEDGWLTGDTEYFWKVEGVVRDQDAEPRMQLPCERPRSFKLEKRQTVQISLAVPDGFEGRVGGADNEFSTSIISVSIENGERREVVLRPAGGGIIVAGRIRVVAVNGNMKYGKITIDNIKPDELRRIAKGDVGVYHYELGGERIVELELGGKSLSGDRGVTSP